MQANDVIKNILEIAKSIKYNRFILNERYLHHYFSYQLQEDHKSLNLTDTNAVITLHPEWPTRKKQMNLSYGTYKKKKKIYLPDKNGRAGFIDFAIGDYNEPEIGIEFCLKYKWSNEKIVYDFLKLLDRRNPFKTSISFNIIFRENGLVKGKRLKDLEERIDNAYKEAVSRLKNDICDEKRKLVLIVTEIDKDNKRRHWHYDRTNHRFKNSLPVIT